MLVGRSGPLGGTSLRAPAMLLVAASLLIAGCRSDPEGGGDGAEVPTGPRCLYAGDSCLVASGAAFPAPALAAFQSSCEGAIPPGSFAPSGSCSLASAVAGYCQFPDTSMAGVIVAGATMRGYYDWPAHDAAAAAARCASDGGTWVADSGSTIVRCLFSDSCDELTGALTAADRAELEGLCGGVGGSYAAGPCPTGATVPGYCAATTVGPSSGVFTTVATRFFATDWDATTALDECWAIGGVWVGGT